MNVRLRHCVIPGSSIPRLRLCTSRPGSETHRLKMLRHCNPSVKALDAARQRYAGPALAKNPLVPPRALVVVRFKEDRADTMPSTLKGAAATGAGMAVDSPRELTTRPVVGPTASVVYDTLSWITLLTGIAATTFPGFIAKHLFEGGLIPTELKLLVIAAGATMIPVSQALRTLMVARDLHLTETRTAQQLCYMGVVWGLMNAFMVWNSMPYLDSPWLRLYAVVGLATAVLCLTTMHRVTETAEGAVEVIVGPQITGLVKGAVSFVRVLTQCALSVFSPVNRPSLIYSFMSLFFLLGGLASCTREGQALLIGSSAPTWLGLTRDAAATIATRMLTIGLYAASTLALALKEISDRGLQDQPMPGGMNCALGIMSTIIAIVGIAAWQTDVTTITKVAGTSLGGFLALGLYCLYHWSKAPSMPHAYAPSAALPHGYTRP